jgi:hypothetical protein
VRRDKAADELHDRVVLLVLQSNVSITGNGDRCRGRCANIVATDPSIVLPQVPPENAFAGVAQEAPAIQFRLIKR